MKINDILTEDQKLELHHLQEGPMLNKIGQGVGKVAGTAAKAVGSVAGGVAGLGSAFMKGFRGGRDTVAAAGDEEEGGDTSAPSTAAKTPAGATAAGGGAGKSTAAGGGAAPSGAGSTAAPAATDAPAAARPAAKPKSDFGRLSAAAGGRTEPTLDQPKADTAYSQAQKAVDGLAPEQKKEIVTMLQADPKVKAAMERPAAKKPAAAPSAMGAMAKDLANSPAAAPTSTSSTGGTTTATATGKVHKANPNNPNAAPTAAPATPTAAPATPTAAPAGEAPPTKNKKVVKKKPAAPSQAEIDADRERLMGVTSDSVIRKNPSLVENFSLFRRV